MTVRKLTITNVEWDEVNPGDYSRFKLDTTVVVDVDTNLKPGSYTGHETFADDSNYDNIIDAIGQKYKWQPMIDNNSVVITVEG